MDSELAAESASINRHKKYMLLANPVSGNKKRYIEVFQCSSNDMNVILTNPELPTSPTISNYLPSTMNLTPPSAPPQISPTHGSPTGAASINAPQNLPVNFQPFLPRNPLIPARKWYLVHDLLCLFV